MQKVKKSRVTIFFTIAWIFFSGSTVPLYAAWSSPVQISAGPSSTNPSGTPLVINSNSVALVGWLDGPIGVGQTLSSSDLLPQSETWSAPQVIYTNTIPGSFPSFPTLSQDINGGSVAAFGVIDPMTGIIILNATRRPPGTEAWPAPFTLALTGNPATASLAVDDIGNVAALLTLTTTGTPPYAITLVQLPATSTSWLAPITLAQDNSTQPALAAKTYKGQGAFAWKVNTPTLQLQTIRFNFLTQQASPIIDVPLPPLTTDILRMDIAVDSRGDSILIYAVQTGSTVVLYSSTGGVPAVQVSSQAVGQNWITPDTLSFSGFFPLITLGDQGTAVATWIDSVTNVLMGSRNLFLFTLASPSDFVGKIIKNAFLTQEGYFLKMRWNRSLAPNITNYQLFKNGQLIATIPGEGPFKFLQSLPSKYVKGAYTLVATASNGNKSSPVPLVIHKK